jgi:hypothetical protein
MALKDMLRQELERVMGSNDENSSSSSTSSSDDTSSSCCIIDTTGSSSSAAPSAFVADRLNLPDSNEFVLNSNELKLHVRSYWPADSTDVPPKAAIIFLHGYNSHGCRPTHTYMAG